METWKLIIYIIGLLLILTGVFMIYDARIIVKKLFSFGDQNEAALGAKIIGLIVIIIGAGIIIFA